MHIIISSSKPRGNRGVLLKTCLHILGSEALVLMLCKDQLLIPSRTRFYQLQKKKQQVIMKALTVIGGPAQYW